jgi:hypothetical protein
MGVQRKGDIATKRIGDSEGAALGAVDETVHGSLAGKTCLHWLLCSLEDDKRSFRDRFSGTMVVSPVAAGFSTPADTKKISRPGYATVQKRTGVITVPWPPELQATVTPLPWVADGWSLELEILFLESPASGRKHFASRVQQLHPAKGGATAQVAWN